MYVNDKPVTLYRGMKVKHALISYDYSIYQACAQGDLAVEDEQGFHVGLEGALHEGARLHTVKTRPLR